MKQPLLIILFFVSLIGAKAQDKIITTKQDTIECRIISVNAERIHYEQKTADKHFVGLSIPSSEVLKYVRTGKSKIQDDRIDPEKAKRRRPEHRWLFSLQGGLAHSYTDYSSFKKYLLEAGNPASATNDFIQKLENGVHINTSLHYLLTSFFGLGVDYNFFHSASDGEFLANGYGTLEVPLYSKLEVDGRMYTHFAGPSVLFQQFPDRKRRIKISETISPGMVMFRNENRDSRLQPYVGYGYGYPYGGQSYYGQYNSLSKGTTYGAKGSLSVEYGFTPQLSAGLAGNFMWAQLQKMSTKRPTYETDDQKLQDPKNISHLDYGFIVRFNF